MERKSLLDEAQRVDFQRAVACGASNEKLAARFKLTRRQAHGLRIGYARAKNGCVPKKPEHLEAPRDPSVDDREQQEIFLRQRPPQPPTMDDVVRFLRQLGDIVVKNGEGYQVNYRLTLMPQELVERANRKRLALGKSLFTLPLPPTAQLAGLPSSSLVQPVTGS